MNTIWMWISAVNSPEVLQLNKVSHDFLLFERDHSRKFVLGNTVLIVKHALQLAHVVSLKINTSVKVK